MGWDKKLKAAFLTAAVLTSGNALAQQENVDQAPVDTNETSELQNKSQATPEADMTSVHGPTGCEAYASSDGMIEIACFGNPYQGDPNPGMIVTVDLNAGEMSVMNTYEITADGQLNEIDDPQMQTYPLSFTQDGAEADKIASEMGFELPSLLKMGDSYRDTNSETGLFNVQSDNGNLEMTIRDTGKISESVNITKHNNPVDGSQTTVTITHNKVAVQTAQPGEIPATSFVDIGQKSFADADFRNTESPTTPKAKAPTKSGLSM
ncbi:MAG: hypothetical protein ACQEQL_00350 [Pseudomonadota bacterium]